MDGYVWASEREREGVSSFILSGQACACVCDRPFWAHVSFVAFSKGDDSDNVEGWWRINPN